MDHNLKAFFSITILLPLLPKTSHGYFDVSSQVSLCLHGGKQQRRREKMRTMMVLFFKKREKDREIKESLRGHIAISSC